MKIYKKTMILICIIYFMGGLVFLLDSHASTKRMTVYDQVIKDGKNCYCGGSCGIIKVNLKTGKRKQLVEPQSTLDVSFEHMKKKGHWIYYIADGETSNKLYRVNVSNGKIQELFTPYDININNYAISGSKIYFRYYDTSDNEERIINMVMKCDGKGKKKTKVKSKNKYKKSNAKGYTVVEDPGDSSSSFYLKTPKKKYFLGTFQSESSRRFRASCAMP